MGTLHFIMSLNISSRSRGPSGKRSAVLSEENSGVMANTKRARVLSQLSRLETEQDDSHEQDPFSFPCSSQVSEASSSSLTSTALELVSVRVRDGYRTGRVLTGTRSENPGNFLTRSGMAPKIIGTELSHTGIFAYRTECCPDFCCSGSCVPGMLFFGTEPVWNRIFR